MTIPESVKATVAAATGHANPTIEMRTPQTHQSNQLFDVWVDDRHLIAKQFMKEDEWSESPAREFRSLNLLLPLDIAPRPVFYDPSLAPIVIYEYMDGRMWGRYRPSAEELGALAATMATLHSLPTDGLWLSRGSEWTVARRVAWFHQLLDNYAAWAEVQFSPGKIAVALCRPLIEPSGVILERLYQSIPTRVFCRSDPRFANVIVRPDGRYGFVDWEDAGLRDPALEVADMMLHPEQEDLLSEAECKFFVATYCQAMEFDDESFVRRIQDYHSIFSLFWILVMMSQGIKLSQVGKLAEWQMNELPANQRLQRYLARALAESQYDFDASAYTDVIFFPID